MKIATGVSSVPPDNGQTNENCCSSTVLHRQIENWKSPFYLCFNKTKPLSIPTLPSAFSCLINGRSLHLPRHTPPNETVAINSASSSLASSRTIIWCSEICCWHVNSQSSRTIIWCSKMIASFKRKTFRAQIIWLFPHSSFQWLWRMDPWQKQIVYKLTWNYQSYP